MATRLYRAMKKKKNKENTYSMPKLFLYLACKAYKCKAKHIFPNIPGSYYPCPDCGNKLYIINYPNSKKLHKQLKNINDVKDRINTNRNQKVKYYEMRLRNGFSKRAKTKDSFNMTIGQKIADLIAEGKTMGEICKMEGMPKYSAITAWKKRHEVFRDLIKAAMLNRLEHSLEHIYELMNSVESGELDVKRADFVASQIRWFAEKIHPQYKKIEERLEIPERVSFNITLAPQAIPDISTQKLCISENVFIEAEEIKDNTMNNTMNNGFKEECNG